MLNARFILSAVCALGVAALLFGAAPALRPAPVWPDKIVFGLVPSEGGADILARYKPLAEHLERTLGITVQTMTATDYAGVITAMGHKHVDIAYFGPKAYVEASDRAGARALAMELSKDGVPGYRGLIIAKRGGRIASVDDLKGKSFAFTDPNSASGYLVPLVHFVRDRKVQPKDFFGQVKFAGSHAASVLAVTNGSVDGAATNDLDLARIVASGQLKEDDVTVLWKSELIPGSPIAGRSDLPASLRSAIIGALMTVRDDKSLTTALGSGGYVYASDADFDIMRYLNHLQSEQAKEGKKP